MYRKGSCKNELRWWMLETGIDDGPGWRLKGSSSSKSAFFTSLGLACVVQSGSEYTDIHFQENRVQSQRAISSQRAWPPQRGVRGVRIRTGTNQASQRDELWNNSSLGSLNSCFISKQATMMAPLTLIQRSLCPTLKNCPQQPESKG